MTNSKLLWSIKTRDKDSNSTYLDITKDGDNFVLVNAMETKVVKDNMAMTGISMSRNELEELIGELTSLLTGD